MIESVLRYAAVLKTRGLILVVYYVVLVQPKPKREEQSTNYKYRNKQQQ